MDVQHAVLKSHSPRLFCHAAATNHGPGQHGRLFSRGVLQRVREDLVQLCTTVLHHFWPALTNGFSILSVELFNPTSILWTSFPTSNESPPHIQEHVRQVSNECR